MSVNLQQQQQQQQQNSKVCRGESVEGNKRYEKKLFCKQKQKPKTKRNPIKPKNPTLLSSRTKLSLYSSIYH